MKCAKQEIPKWQVGIIQVPGSWLVVNAMHFGPLKEIPHALRCRCVQMYQQLRRNGKACVAARPGDVEAKNKNRPVWRSRVNSLPLQADVCKTP